MEPHKELSLTEELRPDLGSPPGEYFAKARAFVERFYGDELRAFQSVRFQDVSPEFFAREHAWVVHATGFSAKAVGKFMPKLVLAYGHWSDLARKEETEVMEAVLPVCNNPQKARAVWRMAKLIRDGVDAFGWEGYRDEDLSSPEKLRRLPYVGPVTCFHLARNIGLLECVKPDLHLVRMAEHWGYKDCVAMCEDMRPDGMPLGIVDLILWYAASTFGTLELKRDGGR